MNIKKKISFFALFLISSFFIIDKVSAAEYLVRTTVGGQRVTAQYTPDESARWINDYFKSYRVTFYKADGTRVGEVKDYDLVSGCCSYTINTYYTTPKLEFNGTFSEANKNKINQGYNPIIANAFKDGDYDNWKSHLLNNGELTKFTKELLKNAGIDISKINKKDGLFISIEKVFTIAIDYHMKGYTYGNDYNYVLEDGTTVGAAIEQWCKDNNSNNGMAINECTKGKQIFEPETTYIRGSGAEIGYLIYKIDNGLKIPNTIYKAYTITYNKNGMRLEKSSVSNLFAPHIFGQGIYVNNLDVSNLTKWKFKISNNNKTQIKSAEGTPYLSEFNDPLKGYNLRILEIYGFDTEPECTSERDADAQNKSWTGKACCKSGEIYNTVAKKCVASLDFTPKQGKVTTYKFTPNVSINMCSKNNSDINNKTKVDSTIYNFLLNNSKATLNNKAITNAGRVEYILYNQKYLLNGTQDVYCYNKLETNFSNFVNNLPKQTYSGRFIPITSTPNITKTILCYSDNYDSLSNYREKLKTENSSITVDLNLEMLKNIKYVFSDFKISSKTVNSIKKDQKTIYGKGYNSFSAKITYKAESLNKNNGNSNFKYVNILNAKGFKDASNYKNNTYKTLTSNINIGIPTETPSNTYTNTINLNIPNDDLLSKITDSKTYSKSFSKNASTSNYCKISYSKKSVSATTCTNAYTNILKKSNKNNLKAYNIKYTGSSATTTQSSKKGTCTFSVIFNISEKECNNITGANIKTNFINTEDYTKIIFDNKTSNSPIGEACNFDIEVKDYELVFRPISLSDPFPGSNGKGRTPNSKVWTSEKIGRYISSRKDAYTKKPLYSVTLTSSQIKNIRKYNKNHKYDDFNLKCVGSKTGTACYSDFIRTYLNTNKSVCANTNNQSEKSFNSCADYSKRQ